MIGPKIPDQFQAATWLNLEMDASRRFHLHIKRHYHRSRDRPRQLPAVLGIWTSEILGDPPKIAFSDFEAPSADGRANLDLGRN